MPALARGDAERLIRFVSEAESLGGEDHPVSGDLLFELGRIVAADWVTYYEHDCVPSHHFLDVGRTGDSDQPYVSCVIDLNENPIRLRRRQREFGALRISDFLTRRELHRTRLYDVNFRPVGVEQALEVDVPSQPSHWKTFAFERSDSERAFTERDRLVLDLLQPHLGSLWQAASMRRRLAAARAGLEQTEPGEPRGVILLGARDEFEYASAPARRLLPELTADGSLVEWLESGCPGPLVHRAGDRRLIVERVGDALLLEETRDAVSLTVREREVLGWVARGKTNPEIARKLWLAPSTVSKHLEHIYAKLGVKTRTAAIARFLGPIEVEGEDVPGLPSPWRN